MFLAGKPEQKQTFLAKKGKKNCSWLENQDKNKHCWQKRGKNCSWLGKSQNIMDAGWRKRLLNNC